LLQIVGSFPGLKNYGYFIASIPSRPHQVRSAQKHLEMFSKVIPGELVTGHTFFLDLFARELSHRNIIQFFVYRDLRDVILSEAYYLTYMNSWHELHWTFARELKSDEDRIGAAITGLESTRFDYPDIRTRWLSYAGWLDCEHVFSVKYEDLISAQRENVIKRMISFYRERTGLIFDEQKLLEDCIHAIQPQKSHTFRLGGVGKWRSCFTSEHIALCKPLIGDLLIDLGYEDDLDW